MRDEKGIMVDLKGLGISKGGEANLRRGIGNSVFRHAKFEMPIKHASREEGSHGNKSLDLRRGPG